MDQTSAPCLAVGARWLRCNDRYAAAKRQAGSPTCGCCHWSGGPNAIWALALNFEAHIAETGLQTSEHYPHLFLRTATSLVGAGEALMAPPESISRRFDYEGELVVVIGRPGRHIPRERALEHVAGYHGWKRRLGARVPDAQSSIRLGKEISSVPAVTVRG